MTIGFTTDTTPLDPMSDDLRDLLADLAAIYLRKHPENGCMLWETIVEYTKWLSIIKDVPDDPNVIYSPCKDIDKLWHLHILCTKNYAAVCEILCGQMINHRLVFESDSARLKRFTAAVTAIRRIGPFTKKTADMWSIPLQSPAFNYAPVGMVFIKMLSGRTEKVDYHPKYTIGDLLIKCDIYCASASIIFAGKSLKLDETCEYYNVDHGSTIHHALSLRGC
jgi:hypothetical protein